MSNFIYNLGYRFGTELQEQDRDNWSLLESGDEIPAEDYRLLERVYGGLDRSALQEYRNGFNAAFVAQIGGAQ